MGSMPIDDDGGSEPDPARLRARREPPAFRRVRVASTVDLTPRLRRVVVGGAELHGFALDEPAASVRLLLPDPHGTLILPTWTGNQFELPDGTRAPIRTLTPRHFDADRSELTLDVVLHDGGALADWVRTAEVGDEVALSGPGRGFAVDPNAMSWFLVGDESALPAICQLLEHVPASATVEVHVEISAPEARLRLPPHPGLEEHWHVADRGASPGDRLVDAVTTADGRPLPVIWVAGEAASMHRIRTHLFDVRGLARSQATVRGYWKHGRAQT